MISRLALALSLALTTVACVDQPVDAPAPAPRSDDLDLADRQAYTFEQSSLLELDELAGEEPGDDQTERSLVCSDNGQVCCTENIGFCCFFYPGSDAICF